MMDAARAPHRIEFQHGSIPVRRENPRGHAVRLTENCYRLHIFLEHPELVDVNLIADTITSPDLSPRMRLILNAWCITGHIRHNRNAG